jgi:hypothetical protein
MTATQVLGENNDRCIPLIPYTLGRKYKNDDRRSKIRQWVRKSIPVQQCWIACVNPKTDAILKKHRFNLAAAVGELSEEDGWRRIDNNPESLPPIICLGKAQPDGGGEFQVLDGSHRAVGVAKQNPGLELHAFVGVTQA